MDTSLDLKSAQIGGVLVAVAISDLERLYKTEGSLLGSDRRSGINDSLDVVTAPVQPARKKYFSSFLKGSLCIKLRSSLRPLASAKAHTSKLWLRCMG